MNSNTGTAAAVGSAVPDVVPGVQVGQHATLGHHLGPLPVGRVGALRRALEK